VSGELSGSQKGSGNARRKWSLAEINVASKKNFVKAAIIIMDALSADLSRKYRRVLGRFRALRRELGTLLSQPLALYH
jgi:predicted AlkP superfamily pyrophosphatase or phosphodiesterase